MSTAGTETRAHGSFHPSITADGRFVVFDSAAGRLVPDDTNRHLDVFVRDLVRHTTHRVSLTDADKQVDEGSSNGQIAAGGRFVGFQTGATNLLPGGRPDENGQASDVFVRDLQRGTTRLVSRNQRRQQGTHGSTLWDISGTGRYVLFATGSKNFPPLNKAPGIARALFVRDQEAKRTLWVPGSVTTFATFGIRQAQVSDNGRFVAFSLATRGTRRQILVDLATGRKTHLACTVVPCTALVVDDLSPSGRFVTLTTSSNAGPRHIVLYDAHTRTESLVSVDANGASGNGLSIASAVSAGGRFVVYASLSTNLIPGDTNNAWDVFRLDRETGAVTRVDLTAGGGQIPTGIGIAPHPPLPCQLNRSDQSRLELRSPETEASSRSHRMTVPSSLEHHQPMRRLRPRRRTMSSTRRREGGHMFLRLIILGAVCGTVVLALSGPWDAAGTTKDDHVQTIVVKSELTSFHFVDVGPPGVSPGDETTFTKTLTKPTGGVAGFSHGTCVVITVVGNDPQSAECQSTIRLGRGTLEVDGLDHLKEPQTFAIVGGTGRYRDAEGVFIAGGAENGAADLFEVPF